MLILNLTRGKSGIRVLSSAGTETYITTLRPLSAE